MQTLFSTPPLALMDNLRVLTHHVLQVLIQSQSQLGRHPLARTSIDSPVLVFGTSTAVALCHAFPQSPGPGSHENYLQALRGTVPLKHAQGVIIASQQLGIHPGTHMAKTARTVGQTWARERRKKVAVRRTKGACMLKLAAALATLGSMTTQEKKSERHGCYAEGTNSPRNGG
ncbi:unnamed protein product [Pleuronectes platessa]|uniref:Uncharacterized protein n=1 Tax=Pleuronectes platessa TaxID=8262 RepID=A0A9N7UG94_PLEPL|nr:unnamed protein product [Pleuronectes platessa]